MSKNFTKNFNEYINEVTAEPLPEHLQPDAVEDKAADKKEKARKDDYTEEEKALFMKEGRTSGRKGCKMPRVNIALPPNVYDYVHIMARVQGIPLTEFCGNIIRKHMEDNKELYDKALEFRQKL